MILTRKAAVLLEMKMDIGVNVSQIMKTGHGDGMTQGMAPGQPEREFSS